MPVLTQIESQTVKHLEDILLRYAQRMDMQQMNIAQVRMLLEAGAYYTDERLRQKVERELELYKGLLKEADPKHLWCAAQTLNKKYIRNLVGELRQ